MAKASPNLALIKYWGKRDLALNIPSNSSVSISLNKLSTTTTVEAADRDSFILNGSETEINPKMRSIISLFRSKTNKNEPIRIISTNSFPEACGMASSASGFAALTLALEEYYHSGFTHEELGEISRTGSGSAGRSIFDGIVLMKDGVSSKIGDWPELKVFSILLSSERKKVSSTEGMVRSSNTSYFYQRRLEHMDERVNEMISALRNKDFEKVAKITMKDSNEFHSVCMDSYPPIRYILDSGFQVIEKVHELNKDKIIAAYSFDAGTNPFIITLLKDVEKVKNHFSEYKLTECN